MSNLTGTQDHISGTRPLTAREDNTAFPDRPNYRRPDRADDYRAATPIAPPATNLSGTTLEQAHAAMVHASNEFRKHVDATFADRDRYSEKGLAEQLSAFSKTSAAKAVDTALANVQAVHDKAQAAVDTMRETFVNPGDAAQESRNLRFWNRTKPILDSLDPGAVMQEAEKLLAKADRDTLGVLLEELPSYLRLRIGNLDNATKLKLGLPEDADWGDWIDTTYLPLAIPEYAAARKKAAKAKQAMAFAKQNANTLRNAFADGNATALVLSNPLSAGSKYDPEK
ncbi:hypothetical protein [Mycolicibacterium sp. D5.8-2]|uniref:hypothetical protein n=1 Tax=Mycolicibacterium sp. D5.8-2 TaxID=3085903 RepID=UPI00298BD1FD|nr:hypothetical protein [Mycolicibacterium sp. D5.8-2]MDW5609734.1 hypothetical protein [Mycolicibacterium sp. D5.8-2]